MKGQLNYGEKRAHKIMWISIHQMPDTSESQRNRAGWLQVYCWAKNRQKTKPNTPSYRRISIVPFMESYKRLITGIVQG